MKKIKVIFSYRDSVFDISHTEEKVVFKVDENNILFEKDGNLVIEKITYETDKGLVVDFDSKKYTPAINISLQNVNSIDLTNKSVMEFARFLAKVNKN